MENNNEKERVIDTEKEELKRHRRNVVSLMKVVTLGVVLFWALNHIPAIGGALSYIYRLFTPVIVGLIVAFIMNTLMSPLESLWGKLFGKRRGKLLPKIKRPVCLVLSFIIIVGVLFAVVFMLVPELERTGNEFIARFTEFIRRMEVKYKDLLLYLQENQMELPKFEFKPEEIIKSVTGFVTNQGDAFLDKTIGTIGVIFSTLFDAVLGFVFAFYFVAQKEKLCGAGKKAVYALLREKRADGLIRVCRLTRDTFTRFVTGQVTEALIIGLMCFIGMLIFRFPYAPVISVLVGLTALIPVFGSFIGTAIGAVLILPVNFFTALWFVIYIIVLQQLENNLIYPRVVGRSLGLPGVLVLLSITVGGSVFGFMGMILSVPACSVIYTLVCERVSYKLSKKSKLVREKAE